MKIVVCVLVAVACGAYGEKMEEEQTDKNVADCDNQACMRACQGFGFAGGNCRKNDCKCYRYFASEENFVNLEKNALLIQAEVAACDNLRCSRACSAYGCIGGSCTGTDCRCTGCKSQKTLSSPLEVSNSIEYEDVYHGYAACSPAVCQRDCIRIGGHGGMCIAGRCVCT